MWRHCPGIAALAWHVAPRIATKRKVWLGSNFGYHRKFAYDSEQHKQRAAAQSQGAVPVGPILAAGAGLAAIGWYMGWFEGKSSKPDRMIAWLQEKRISVVVFELDGVMVSAKHFSGSKGVPKHYIEDYLTGTSQDFIEAAGLLARRGFRLAVATRGDPRVYDLPGLSQDTHLVGSDLAKLVLAKRVPGVGASTASGFGLFVGSDANFESGGSRRREDAGKRQHMRRIAAHYGVPCTQLVLFDSQREDLDNEDGWTGILVQDPMEGFRFDDIPGNMS